MIASIVFIIIINLQCKFDVTNKRIDELKNINIFLNQKFNNLCEFEKKLTKDDKSFLKNLKSNVILMNDFINNDNVKLSTFFKRFVLDLMFD